MRVAEASVIGHRGNPGNKLNTIYLENSIPSLRSGLAVADGIEFDVHLTSDGELVIFHDDTLAQRKIFTFPGACAGRTIPEFTYDELQHAVVDKKLAARLNVRNHSQFRIPRLQEILPLPESKMLFLELKIIGDKEPETTAGVDYINRLAKATVEFLEKNDLIDRTYVLCFVGSALNEIKKLNPDIKTAFNVYEKQTKGRKVEDKIRELQDRVKFEIINPPFDQIPNSSIDVIHNLGLETYPWVWRQRAKTELAEVRRLLENGVDGVISNQPEEASRILQHLTNSD